MAPMHNGPAIIRGAVGETGGRTWARTKDPLIKSQLLYQLSYASIGRDGGADPATRLAIGRRAFSTLADLCKCFFAYQRVERRFSRSIAIMIPRHNSTVICDDPP